MKKSITLICILVAYLIAINITSCKGGTDKNQTPETSRLDVKDTSSLDIEEKHFDCIIEEVIGGRSHPPYAYITECGILFYADLTYRAGDTLKGFQSPKHK